MQPDYRIEYDNDNDKITFINRDAEKSAIIAAHAPSASTTSLRLSEDIHEHARRYVPGWDTYALEREWRAGVHEKGLVVKNADAHFIGFCKKRGPYWR